ncbi:MAG TPA: AAA family ATPase, partial [Candidatus Competibacteraceae bacterium]|nr:AAA family ATPase [Candidatus Competibacteraceae bacterium]
HPGFGYEDFVEGYRPDGTGFTLRPGVLRRLVAQAEAHPGQPFVLVVDEINRGDLPRTFGELITLLEPGRRGELKVRLPLSGELLTLPPNLYLIGTMNSADRSIVTLDAALRRRFAFLELNPRPELLDEVALGRVSLGDWLRALNRRLAEQLGQEGRRLQLGHGYFLRQGRPLESLADIADVVRDALWPLLQEYCDGEPALLQAILGADGLYDAERGALREELFVPGREEELTAALLAVVEQG